MYKSSKLILFLMVLLFQVCTGGYAQTNELTNVEQVSIVTDRLLYLSGETVWFVADYNIEQDVGVSLSKVLYVDLYNNEKQLVKKQKFLIENGYVEGNFDLSEQLSTGYYILRAYTRYQTNFPSWQLSSTVLSIVNPYHPLDSKNRSQKGDMSMAISNSGNLIFGIDQPLAKIVNKVILLNNNKLVDSSMRYYRNGIGESLFVPDSNNFLKLQVILTNGDTIYSDAKHINIPRITFAVIPENNEIEFDLSAEGLNSNYLKLTIFNFPNRSLVTTTGKVRNNKVRMVVSDLDNYIGLNQITIFLEDGDTLMQTFVAIADDYIIQNNSDRAVLGINSDSIIEVNLSELSIDNFPVSISLALKSATTNNKDLLPEYLIKNPLMASNIVYGVPILLKQLEYSSILLSTSLLYGIESAESSGYFVIPEVYGLTVQGKVENTTDYSNEKIYCSVLGDDPQFHVATINNEGRFVVALDNYMESKDIYLVSDYSDSNLEKIYVESGYCSIPPMWSPVSFIPDSSMRKTLTDMFINYQIVNVFDINRQQDKQVAVSSLPLFSGNLHEIQLTDYVQMATTQELFNEVVPFVKVRKKSGNYIFTILDDEFNIQYDNPMVLLDNIYFADINQIMNFQPTEIISVGVMNKPYAYGNSVFNGVISITTSSGNFDGVSLPKNGIFFDYDSELSMVNFMPFDEISKSSLVPDFANTAFWMVVNHDEFRESINIKSPSNIGPFELVITRVKDGQVIVKKQY